MSEDGDFEAIQAPVSPRDIAELIDQVLKLTDVAMGLRQRNNWGRALKQMENAVRACEGHEQSHPAMAVEGARARLNLGAMLSSCNRHAEALDAVRGAKQNLESVLVWAQDCGAGDLGVSSIAEEARSLSCAALVAEAIELESVAAQMPEDEAHKRSPARKRANAHPQVPTAASAAAIAEEAVAALLHRQQLYATAQAQAEGQLPQSHPMTSLVKKLSAETASPSMSSSPMSAGALRSTAGQRSNQRSLVQSRGLSLPPLKEATGAEQSQEAAAAKQGDASGANGEVNPEAGDGTNMAQAHGYARTRGQLARREEDRGDMFSEFIRNIEASKTARLNDKNPRLQEEAKKKLGQIHRSTQLLLELSNDEDLKDKRYTKIGHKVFMNSMTKENRCRSDPALTQEARRSGAPPEVILVKKLNKVMYVKPPTPPPPPPRQESKPLLPEEFKALNMYGRKP